MARTFTLSGNSSVLSANFYPPIELDRNKQYGLGLHGFYSYNSILNIHEGNNVLVCNFRHPLTIKIPPGAYEIDEINKAIQSIIISKLGVVEEEVGFMFSLTANNNTLKCEITSPFDVDMSAEKSIATLLGFERTLYKGGKTHESTLPVNITNIRIIRVDCNITGGAYVNGTESHTLFEFDIDVEPGFKLTKEPQHIIYMPIKPYGRQFIDNITLRILGDSGELVDFCGEKIIIKLELKDF